MEFTIEPKKVAKTIAGLIIGALIWSYWPLQSVPTGTRGVITQFGRIIGIQQEGLAFVPMWQRLSIFNIRAEEAAVENADGSTSDTQPVKVSMTVRYAIGPDRVAEVYEKYSHDGNLQSYVQTATAEVFKAVTAKYTAPDLIAKRQQVSADIRTGLSAKLSQYGAGVLNIDMTNFAFNADYMAVIGEKVKQEQMRLAAENKLRTVEAEQKQKVAIAEADGRARQVSAEAQANATLTIAKADAESLRMRNAAIAQSKDVLELERLKVEMAKAGKWDGKLPENIYSGAPIPFLQLK